MSMFVYPKQGWISFIQADNANVTISRSGDDTLIICINGAYFIARTDDNFTMMSIEDLNKLRELQKRLEQKEQEVQPDVPSL